MTVFINARFLCQPLSGVQRFAGEILTALDNLISDNPDFASAIGRVVALHPEGALRQPTWRKIGVRQLGRTRGHVWEQGALHRASKDGVLVSLGNAGPLRHNAQILALHDANIWDIPDAFSSTYKLLHKTMRPLLAARAKHLLTVSAFSADALSQRLGVERDRFSIIPNGADHVMRREADPWALQKHDLHQGGYLLCVGNLSRNKNIERLIQAHEIAGPLVPPLAIAGGAVAGIEAQRLPTTKKVRYLGRVSDEALRSLYENAAGFVFPSLYEGFGIPPLEAMRLGTPVLSSNRTAMPEVLQDAPLYFDPMNVQEMAAALDRFSRLSQTQRSQMVVRGRQVANEFTWEKSAQLLAQKILTLKVTLSNGARGVRTVRASQLRKAS